MIPGTPGVQLRPGYLWLVLANARLPCIPSALTAAVDPQHLNRAADAGNSFVDPGLDEGPNSSDRFHIRIDGPRRHGNGESSVLALRPRARRSGSETQMSVAGNRKYDHLKCQSPFVQSVNGNARNRSLFDREGRSLRTGSERFLQVGPKLLHQIPEPFIERAARTKDAFSDGSEVYSCGFALADERKVERSGVPDLADIRLTLQAHVNRSTVGGDNYLPIGSDDRNGGSISDHGDYEKKNQPGWVRHRYTMFAGCLEENGGATCTSDGFDHLNDTAAPSPMC